MFFRQITDPALSQYAYLIGCQRTGEALLVDPERDIDRYDRIAADEGLRITTVAETHIHADFLSGAREYAARGDVRLVLSAAGPADWQYDWAVGLTACLLVRDGDRFRVGNIDVEVRHTPGHTPEHIVFLVTDRGSDADSPMGVATGDFLFVGDVGRPDLLEAAAGVTGAMRPAALDLQGSLRHVAAWPEFMQIWPGHGAGSACGKALGAVPTSTVGYERRFNGALALSGEQPDAFVDAILAGQPEPPPYFARMKRLNREGAPSLGIVPMPPRLSVAEVAGNPALVVIDTREDRADFMTAHLPGSLYGPLPRHFTATLGAYVDADQSLVFLCEPHELDELVRQSVRIGFDKIHGWFTHADFADWRHEGGAIATIDRISFPEAAAASKVSTWLDVRGAGEFAERHVEGALNIAQPRLAVDVERIPRERPVTVHCATGGRAALASAYLQRLGYEVRYVDDDFARWRQPAGPVGSTPR
ncbi:MAG TPA: MBL fold metallo-hydrolase [Luteitalea sp.]|nr:MBL fold metallo-hydrolase [Luteitalea sp.]